jgi:serine/threonine protein kinase
MSSIEQLVGRTLGSCELRELLGVGGMGAVYRAYQKSLSREVAVKVMSPDLVKDATFLERFEREAKTSAALEHAHIVAVYEYGVEGKIGPLFEADTVGELNQDGCKGKKDVGSSIVLRIYHQGR